MNCNTDQLWEHERAALVEALRRDLRSESFKATTETAASQAYHRANARMLIRLLEYFAPRSKTRVVLRLNGVGKRAHLTEHPVEDACPELSAA